MRTSRERRDRPTSPQVNSPNRQRRARCGHDPGQRDDIGPVKALIQPGDAPVHEWQHNKGALEHEADAPLSGRLDSFLKQIAVELVPELGMWPTLGAKGDLKLLAEEQVLDDEAPTATEGGDESDPYGAGRVEHRCEIAD